MSKHKGLKYKTAALAFIALASTVLRAQSPDLPEGAMQAKVRNACTECHDARIILQQRLSKGAWLKEVDKMIKWGAVIDASDHDAFVEYLSANFSPDKPAYVAERTSASRGKSNRSP